MPDRNVTIVLPDELIDPLDLLAAELGVSRSALIRRAVVRFIPNANAMVDEMRSGDVSSELLTLVMGIPVKQTGDETDQEFTDALKAIRGRAKAERRSSMTSKKRPGRPRKVKENKDA